MLQVLCMLPCRPPALCCSLIDVAHSAMSQGLLFTEGTAQICVHLQKHPILRHITRDLWYEHSLRNKSRAAPVPRGSTATGGGAQCCGKAGSDVSFACRLSRHDRIHLWGHRGQLNFGQR